MPFDDRWSYETRISTILPIFGWALVIGAFATGLQLVDHYIGLPHWFVEMWVRR